MIDAPGCMCGSAALTSTAESVDVGLHDRIEMLAGDLKHRLVRLLLAGDNRKHVDPLEPLHGSGDEVLARSLACQVARERPALRAAPSPPGRPLRVRPGAQDNATSAPSRAYAITTARLMPESAPVTIATRSCNLPLQR